LKKHPLFIKNPFSTDFDGNPFVIEKDLAPFVDVNKDSLYNPLDGDFPLMKGDKMVFWVMNDDTSHDLSNGDRLGVNNFCKAYAYDKPAIPTIHHTIFVEMEIINESDIDYTNLNLGLFNDFDIGCSDNDYIGSYPSGHFFYAYNRNSTDNSCRIGGVTSDEFGEKVPVQTTLFLNKQLDKFQYFLRDDTAPASGMSDPIFSSNFYNLMSGMFADGTPLTIGGTGYNSTGTNALTNYAFSGNPADATSWTMCKEALGRMDVRGLGISGPYELAAGEKLTFSVAHTFFENIPHPCPDIEPIAEKLEQLRNFHQTGYFGTEPIITSTDTILQQSEQPTSSFRLSQPTKMTASLTLYPNPAQASLNVILDHKEISGQVSYQMLNHLGQNVFYKKGHVEKEQKDFFTIDVQHLPSGVYTFYATHSGKIIEIKKVLIF